MSDRTEVQRACVQEITDVIERYSKQQDGEVCTFSMTVLDILGFVLFQPLVQLGATPEEMLDIHCRHINDLLDAYAKDHQRRKA